MDNQEKNNDFQNEKYIKIEYPDSIKESYMKWLNTIPSTPYVACEREKELLRIGIELLSINEQSDEELQELMKKASEAYTDAVPKQKNIDYHFQDVAGTKYVIYKITASDAGESNAETERFDAINGDFNDKQYKNITGNLQIINSMVLHELIEREIIMKKTVDDELQNDILQLYKKEIRGEISAE